MIKFFKVFIPLFIPTIITLTLTIDGDPFKSRRNQHSIALYVVIWVVIVLSTIVSLWLDNSWKFVYSWNGLLSKGGWIEKWLQYDEETWLFSFPNHKPEEDVSCSYKIYMREDWEYMYKIFKPNSYKIYKKSWVLANRSDLLDAFDNDIEGGKGNLATYLK